MALVERILIILMGGAKKNVFVLFFRQTCWHDEIVIILSLNEIFILINHIFSTVRRSSSSSNEGVWDFDHMCHILFLESDGMRTVASFWRGKIVILSHIEKLHFILRENYIYVGVQRTHHGRENHFFLFKRFVGIVGSHHIFVALMKNVIFQ